MAYQPETPPDTSDALVLSEWIMRELRRVAEFMELVETGRFLPMLYVAPAKPREGMLAVADGTSWNPGSGKGLYEYRSGAWAKL